MTIGLPQAGLYFEYEAYLRSFFAELGIKTIVSPQTTKDILKLGLELAPTQTCYPVKILAGHIKWLQEKADLILALSVNDRKDKGTGLGDEEYGCPYLVAQADFLRAIDDKLSLLQFDLIKRDGQALLLDASRVAAALDVPLRYVENAARNAAQTQFESERSRQGGITAGAAVIGVVGRSYVLHDEMANLGIMRRLKRAGYGVMLGEQLSDQVVAAALENIKLKLRQHWIYANDALGQIAAFNQLGEVKGILYMIPFSCGPDSQITQYVVNDIHPGKPFATISVDEGSAEAGVVTRVEAFLDLIK